MAQRSHARKRRTDDATVPEVEKNAGTGLT
jgi:hypothetical protein